MDAYFQWLNERHRAEPHGIAPPAPGDFHTEPWRPGALAGCGGPGGAGGAEPHYNRERS